MPSAHKGEGPKKKDAHTAGRGAGTQGGKAGVAGGVSAGPAAPAPGAPKTEAAGLTSVGPPKLPPFWVEWGRVIAEKWPLPVFTVAVLTSIVVFLARPKGEPPRTAEQYVAMARKSFEMAVTAQDERGDLKSAVQFLGGQNVTELADALEQGRGPSAAGQVSGAGNKALGVHGVVPSYERAERLGGKGFLGSDDLALMGEAFYRLGRIREDYPNEAGRVILLSAGELYRKAEERLAAARRAAEEEAKGRFTDRDGQKAAESAVAEFGGPEWRRRRRVSAECQMQLGRYPAALSELRALMESLAATQAEEFRSEKEPVSPGASASGRPNTRPRRSADEWAEVYELAGHCYDKIGQSDKAVEHYRLFLEQGTGGQMSYRVRLRLAELVMAGAVSEMDAGRVQEMDAAKVRAGLGEVCRLCAQVEQSDAPGALREDATFLLGRAAYRLGALETEPNKARSRYEEAAAAFRYPYAPGGPHQDMSRVLLARSLHLAGKGPEARELLAGILRIGAQPAIYACAEVSRADMLVESNPEEAFGGGELASGTSHGYAEAIRHIRDLSAAEVQRLVPELAVLLADGHFVVPDPDPSRALRPREAQLLRIARNCSATHDYDLAARIYRHILDNYPQVESGRYYNLRGEVCSEQAAWLARQKRPEKEIRAARLAAARDFMLVELPSDGPPKNPLAADAWWQAGKCYYEARRYDGASLAFESFTRGYGDDGRMAEALYLWGDSLRQMGNHTRAAEKFGKAAVEHSTDQFGYLAQLALGETYLEMGRLEEQRLISNDVTLTVNVGSTASTAAPSASAATTPVTGAAAGPTVPTALLAITAQPASQTVNAGEKATFAVGVEGEPTPLYQWRKNGVDIAGATASSYTTPATAAADGGATFSVVVASAELGHNARAVFESIRRDARYTPESQVWMKALFRLGETYYLLGRSRLARAAQLELQTGKEADKAKALAEGQELLRRAMETLEDASERYPLARYQGEGKRRSFKEFLSAERLPVMRMLALIRLDLEQYDQAAARFAEILQVTGEVGAFDQVTRAERDEHRRAAYAYKGIAELCWGASELRRGDRAAAVRQFETAAGTFWKAHEEFARTPDGARFAMACGMAYERAGRDDQAREKYKLAEVGYGGVAGDKSGAPPQEPPGKSSSAEILAADAWRGHCKWLLEGM